MGHIIDTKNLPNKSVTCKILLDDFELSNLGGHLKNVSLFAANLCNTNATINTRGNQGVTKYFKIPLNIRSRSKHNGNLTYQKIETASKIYYIYSLGKSNEEEDFNNKK